ncbi:HPr family phosphocarrier protein [Clostridium sp. MCC353]|uniref:HPr family phosphocarrier protein n=1 Tax=Clostridium sp. MCC353 TaxID=2592646 RepID=UPI001C02015A|nr:HPr family phosphocarrier protein [Clostridium sp. MCC353]MBT9778289.1 HPr family phosphocarrier protein [Clostridium sp. MCC353]
MREWCFQITDPCGLHAKPASMLMMTARKFQSEIRGDLNKYSADLKNVIEILGLGAEFGDRVLIRAEGPDEAEAIEAIKEAFEKERG